MLSITIEKILNRGLPRSPRARALCAELSGKSLAIEVRDITRLRVTSTGPTLAVSRDDAPADATLEGGPLALLALEGAEAQTVIQRGEVTIRGDTELAEKFRELGRLLRPDFEEELAILIGDVPAHEFARLARGALALGQRAAGTTLRNLAEYFGHETLDLVSRNEGEQFLRGVDAVREGVDRLAARLELIERRRGAS
ncbi:MAG TPA: SCP2 sterol-binding domain-containing protein [Steroidobacteraceae bacterium]|nr:SCP2 sterol-binding domain-containing protein [Steroidobacteraceae bacterium]